MGERSGGAGRFRYHLELTPAQLKLTHRALRRLHDELGREQADLRDLLASVLAKLPDETAINAIPLEDVLGADEPPEESAEPPTRLGLAEEHPEDLDDDDDDEPPPTVA